jgi:Fe-S-cluster-containing hydrogenase component 2
MARTKRNIVKIDEDKCNGCGLCVSACAEGAIQMVDGKAKLVTDSYCDGLGACLGECPQGAITIEEREADEFDEAAVKEHLEKEKNPAPAKPTAHSGCPGLAARSFNTERKPGLPSSTGNESELRQWPVQLHLVPTLAPYWEGADILLTADCVAIAYADFQADLLRGRKVITACPKLDDTSPYIDKLTEILSQNNIKSLTVAHMEVPCCSGIVRLAVEALNGSGKKIPVKLVKIGIAGDKLEEKGED